MRLFVTNMLGRKVYLNVAAATRQELGNLIKGYSFMVGTDKYTLDSVQAESDTNNSATGAIVGGLVGTLGGPFGIMVGGFLGGILGNGSDKEENAKVTRFNNS